MKPFFYSAGYNKANGQKIVKRNFKVVRLSDHDCYSYGYVVGYNVSHNTKMHNAVGILKAENSKTKTNNSATDKEDTIVNQKTEKTK